jgi:hypothetical protein
VKYRCTIFHAQVGESGFLKNALGHFTPNLCVLQPMGSVSYVVNFGMSGARNVDALFFVLRWDRYGFHKKHVGTRYTELVFLHPV